MLKKDENKAEKGQPQQKKNMKRFVFGMMMAGGAFGLAGLSAQAHGNASSHGPAQLSWNFDDYIVRRQETFAPMSQNTLELSALESEINTLDRITSKQINLVNGVTVEELTGTLTLSGGGGNKAKTSSTASLRERVDNKVIGQLAEERHTDLSLEKLKLENQLRLTPETRKVLSLLASPNPKQALSLIESAETPEQVMSRYSLVQLDLYNYGAERDRSTPAYLDEIVEVSKGAIAYQESKGKNSPQTLLQLAGILHNLASAATPDVGQVSAEHFALGRNAAERAVTIREQSGDKAATGIAYYMAGVYSYRSKEFAKAQAQFAKSVQLLEPTPSEDLAWSKAFLGLSQIASGKASGHKLFEEARNYFQSKGNNYAVGYLSSLRKS